MIVITGAAGFIGSCLAKRLDRLGRKDLLLVDDFSRADKLENLSSLKSQRVDRYHFLNNMEHYDAEIIFHIGARTDTTEFDKSVFDTLNVAYSKAIWKHAADHNIPLIYASSAATYGDGSLGFSDDPKRIATLRPLNPYGQSKQDFDLWAMQQAHQPPFWAGLKFFNVFGPNEYHKGRMASVVFHTFNQIRKTGGMKLFESHNIHFGNGEQSRDFIYVEDVCDVLMFWSDCSASSGIYNLGTGTSRSFLDLAKAVFSAMDLAPNISFIPTPADLRDTYQYYTCADMSRTRSAGYHDSFTDLEDAVEHYVQQYLIPAKYY